MFTKSFVKQVAERALKTAAQTAGALLASDATGLLDVNWEAVGSAAGLAALLSILTSIASGKVGDPSTPSAVTDEVEDFSDPEFVPDYDERDRNLRH